MMITFEDCLGLCDLDEEEVIAIAEHEHVPYIVAVELAECLAQSGNSAPVLHNMIDERIRHAWAHGDHTLALRLTHMLDHVGAYQPHAALR